MLRVSVLAALAALSAARQPGSAEWMRSAGTPPPPPPPLPPREPDAEVIGPITDPRPIIDGNFQVPHGHRLAGVYRNDKPQLPADYRRFLQSQGLTPEQIEHGAGLGGSRLVREQPPPPPPPRRAPAAPREPTPTQLPLPGGLTLRLEQERQPKRPPLPAGYHPEAQSVPRPSMGHPRSAAATATDRTSARFNEVGVTASDWPAAGGLAKHPDLEDLRRYHQRVKQRLDREWRHRLGELDRRHAALGRQLRRGGGGGAPASGSAPVVREAYSVRQLPGGGRSVAYSKHMSHSTTYTTRGRPSGGQLRQLQRRKRQPARRAARYVAQWGNGWANGRW